jgi:chaperonin cofactor prefoldin
MEEPIITLQETRRQLEAQLPEVHRTLNNWSLEPTWERAAGDWTSVVSDFLSQEASYRQALEAALERLEARVAALEQRAKG